MEKNIENFVYIVYTIGTLVFASITLAAMYRDIEPVTQWRNITTATIDVAGNYRIIGQNVMVNDESLNEPSVLLPLMRIQYSLVKGDVVTGTHIAGLWLVKEKQ